MAALTSNNAAPSAKILARSRKVSAPVAIGASHAAKNAARVDEAFDRADGIVNNGLDNLMLQFEDTHPDFFRDYTNARIIIDRPGGHGNGGTPPPAPPTAPKA